MERAKSIFVGRKPQVDAAVTEMMDCAIDESGTISRLSVQGVVTTRSPRAKRGLSLILSNAYRMGKIHLGPDVKESKLPIGSSVSFDLGRGEREVLTYEADPACIQLPLDCTTTFRKEKAKIECCLILCNVLGHSSIMGSSVRNVKASLVLTPHSLLEGSVSQSIGEVGVGKDNSLNWSLSNIDAKEEVRLAVSSKIEKIEGDEISGELSISFEIPNRTASGIFIDSIRTPLSLHYEIPINRIYLTKCEKMKVKVRHSFAEASSGETDTDKLAIIKLLDKEDVKVGEPLRVSVRVTNLSKYSIRNLTISDQIPKCFRLVEGRTVLFCAMDQGETREISYIVEPLIPGEYAMPIAVANYESVRNRLYSAKSRSLRVHVRSRT